MAQDHNSSSHLNSTTENNLNSGTFERCRHDRKNPYVMINRDLTRNATLSFQARGFLLYLLSHADGWQIKRHYIIDTQNITEHSLKKVIDELIFQGYVLMEKYQGEKGYWNVKYLVSEFPRFKEKIPHFEIPRPEIPDPEIHPTKERTKESKDSYKEINKKKVPSADALDVVVYFLQKLKELHPHLKDPDKTKWALEVDKMLGIDKRTLGQIREAIDFIPEHHWYKGNILSPGSLRIHFDRILAVGRIEFEKSVKDQNRKYAVMMREKYPKELKKMTFDSKGVTNIENGKDVSFNMEHTRFKEVFLSIFGGK